ncbi:MAG: alpha/beta fold hydrolase [Caulobacterales bacterium]
MSKDIVFIHGAFTSSWSFDRFRKPFERAGYRVRTVDLPHHEPKADLDALAACGLREYVRAVERDIADLERPILIGHSMGGLLAQIVASRRPVAAKILLAPAAPWGVGPTTAEETTANMALFALGDFWNRPIDPDYHSARSFALQRFEREEARAMFARFVPDSGRAAFETIHWWRDISMAAAAPAYLISAPVLAIAGRHDALTPPATVRRITGRFGADQATFVEMPDMGHWLVAETGWERVADVCMDWLETVGLGKGRKPKMRPAAVASAL